jgi:hypothetical protein
MAVKSPRTIPPAVARMVLRRGPRRGPRLAGRPLQALARLLAAPVAGRRMADYMMRQIPLDRLRHRDLSDAVARPVVMFRAAPPARGRMGRGSTGWLSGRDAVAVQRLAAAGAVLIGKANLHEIGAGTTGINPHHGTARNPHDARRWCGGSSSGSASGVAAGLVPIALATDAGGSVRAPAAFVGAVGLKPTFGRISRIGLSILCDTLDTIGPIANTCADAALGLCAMAGVHPDDDETWDQPALSDYADSLAELGRPVAGLRIGVTRSLFEHRRVDPRVAACVARAADALADAGSVLADVEVPDIDTCLLSAWSCSAARAPAASRSCSATCPVWARIYESCCCAASTCRRATISRRSARATWCARPGAHCSIESTWC